MDGRVRGCRPPGCHANPEIKSIEQNQLAVSTTAMTRTRRKISKINQSELDSYRIRHDFLQADLTDDSDSDDELPLLARAAIPDSDLPPRYWFLVKVVKYIKVEIFFTFFFLRRPLHR